MKHKYKNTATLFILVVFLSVSVYAKPNISPDNISSKEFLIKKPIGKLSLIPLKVPSKELEVGRSDTESELKRQLSGKNIKFESVSSDRYEKVFSQVAQKLGGFYSPLTGEFLSEKYAKALMAIAILIGEMQGSEYVVFPSFVLKNAEFKNRHARWDGASRPIPIKGDSRDKFANRRGVGFSGGARALSLELMIFDKDGNWISTSYGAVGVPDYIYIRNMRDAESQIKFNEKVFKSKNIKRAVESSLFGSLNV